MPKPEQNEELKEKVISFCKDRLYQVAAGGTAKSERSEAFKLIKDEMIISLWRRSKLKNI